MLLSGDTARWHSGRMRTWPALLVLALLTGACSSGPGTDSPSPAAPADSAGTACETVKVPAHEGVEVRATGVECAAAREIVMGAAGQGRARYEVSGFVCTPSDATDGDTFYDCAGEGGKRITFRYGVS